MPTKKGEKRAAIEVAKSRYNRLNLGYEKLLARQEKARLKYLKNLKDAQSDYEYLETIQNLDRGNQNEK